MDNIKRNITKIVRYLLQWALLLFILKGGFELYRFYIHFISQTPFVDRPTLVDGFLPIGALLSMRLWAASGNIHPVHPAATVILLSALFVSLFFRKSFCGWICPLGTISELIYKIGLKIFGRNFTMHRYLDYFLRSIKYLFLFLVFYLSFVKLDVRAIESFLGNSYWKVADIRMLLLFLNISRVSIIVLTILVVASIFIKKFWCRYLCPYGALTGLLGILSPFKISRNDENCIGCQKCTQSCPNLLSIDQMTKISSPECTVCLTCVSVCPSNKALKVSFMGKMFIKPIAYSLAVYFLFFAIIGVAQITGNWNSQVSYETYKKIVPLAEKMTH